MRRTGNIEDIYPLSPMQAGLLFHTLYAPHSADYFEQFSYTLEGDLNVPVFEQAWQTILARHPILRTLFTWEKQNQPLQIVRRKATAPFAYLDWRSYSRSEQQKQLDAFLISDRKQGFNLSKAPLMRLTLMRLNERRYQFTWSFHHLLLDGWSGPIVWSDFFILYEGLCRAESPVLPDRRPYCDYIRWLQQQDLTQAERFWRDYLKGFTEPTPLGVGQPNSKKHSEAYAKQELILAEVLTASLQQLAKKHRLTISNIIQGVWAIILSRYGSESEVVFGTTVSGRTAPIREIENMVGLFINTLPLRVQVTPEVSVVEWLQALQQQQTERGLYEHSPLTQIQQWSGISANMSLFESILVVANYPMPQQTEPEQRSLTISDVRIFEQTNYPLTVLVRPSTQLLWRLQYDCNRFDDATIARMVGHIQTLLESIVADPDRPLSELPWLTEKERHQLQVEWNETKTTYPKDLCVHHLFEILAEKAPDAIALEFGEKSVTYSELNRRSSQLAHYLRSEGVGPDVLVGICMERSLEMVIGLLGILKAGGAYVPLDPSYPQERLAYMLEETATPVLLTQKQLLPRLPNQKGNIFCLDTDWESIAHLSETSPSIEMTPDNLAYVIYTSGSTGQPKGTCVPHRAINRLVLNTNYINLTPSDRIAQASNSSFDAATFEIWGALLNGACLVGMTTDELLSPQEFTVKIREKRITTLFLTTALFNQLAADAPRAFSSLNHLLFGGEAVDPKWVNEVLTHGAPDRLIHVYGPTENTTFSTWHLVEKVAEDGTTFPIGKPISNTQCYVLDKHMQVVPVGIPGELYLGGDGLARGYFNRPELTKETFVPNPFSETPGDNLYKTGDLVRYLPDGNIEFLGRIDDQIKLRGFRIELSEIETVMSQHACVANVAVIMREDRPGDKKLVAYVVPKKKSEYDRTDLRAFLSKKLPEYMIPQHFVALEKFSITANGKVDRKALPAPDYSRAEQDETFVGPRTPVEETVVEVWEEILQVERIGIHDNFFNLGGHSLLATQVMSKLRDAFKVDLPLRILFEAPTVAGLTLEITRRQSGLSKPDGTIPPRDDPSAPLSFSQQRLWFLDKYNPDSPMYNISTVYQLKGVLGIKALEQAIAVIIGRHEVLRTTFSSTDGNPVQFISKNNPPDILKVIDLSGLPEGDRERKVRESIEKEIQRPFDLAADRMLRATLLQLDPETQILVLVIHHIAFDGWSVEIFNRELSALYEAFSSQKTSQLPNLVIQYADYSAWQRSWLSGEVLQSQLSYWRKQLDGAETCLELPIDYPRPATQTFRGQRHPVLLSKSLTQSLKNLSKQEGTTLFMTLLAAFQTLLYRQTGQDDLIVGIPIAGRDKTETEALIGFFVNTLAIRTVFSEKLTFNELLQKVRETALGAYAYQAFPFEKLVQDLQLDRDPSRPPLVQVMFAFQNMPKRDLMLPGLTVSEMAIDSRTVRFDLEFFMLEEQDRLRGSFVYNADLFNADTVGRMDRHLQMLLEGIVANPQQPISNLPLLSEVEKHQLLIEWNDTTTTYPRNLCIHQLFDIQAEKTPDAVALEFGEKSLSYGELSRRSSQLAHYLRSEGVGPDVLVGICMERSLEMVIGLLGILKAGGAYVPLDPSYPQERLAYMLEETATPVLLTQKQLLPRLPNQKGNIFCLDTDWESIAHLSETSPSIEMTPDNLAYVIYTSGSTGQPKGTCVPHRAINRLVLNTNYINLTPSDRIAQASNSSFDAATFEIWGALLNGACLVGMTTDELLSPQEFTVKIREKRITTLFLTTALFNQLAADAPRAFSSLNHLLFGGEAVDPKWVNEVLTHGAPDRLIHVYGPTENTTFSTWHLVEKVAEDGTTIPIGKPISNTQCYVLDKHMQVVPVGIPGELYLGGDGLARGYFNRPELTKETFVPNPFSETPGDNLYKTGDLVRYLPDGNIEFLGRIDDQIKLRGFRIELSEIETILSQHPHIDNVAVIMREDRQSDKKLVAYFIPKKDLAYDLSDLRTFLSKKLPGYMIPQHFVALEEFPITANGKINRKALPIPLAAAVSREQGFVAPGTAIEAKLAEIWQDLIGTDRLSVNENFFELGGHSLLAVKLFSKLSRMFGIDLPLTTLFEAPTIEGLAQRVEASIEKTNRSKGISDGTAPDKSTFTHLVAIQPNGNRPIFFCMHAAGGNVLNYYSFVDELGSNQPLYGLQSLGLDGISEPYEDIETMAENYIKEMRQVQPHGPYFVGGGSMGGLIAVEVAQQLRQDGEKIGLLAMFDTYAPSYFDPEWFKRKKIFSKNWAENFLTHYIQKLKKQSLKSQIISVYKSISFRIGYRFKLFVCFYYRCLRRPRPHWIRHWYVNEKNKKPAYAYSLKMYDGDLTLFSDSRNAGVGEQDMEKGWREFVSGEIEVVGIPAKHAEFIEEPILAKELKLCLDRAQKNNE